ncbi:MAG: cupin domain-containing protein [Candidatus Riflebacteria bacterium HGW-Riflebacteria-2]|jgi:quercetin dioxygenase-like cupin family protein|nr:MAG: cupin domain-containing protein [Candidatus Riflebacteria bacterium HGW-Riflebacteria-2]
MFCFLDKLQEHKVGPGVIGKYLGSGEAMNVMHWNFDDKAALPSHHHAAVQFGYIIKGAFQIDIGGEKALLKAGDSYFVPSNVEHAFVAVGETEAIDVFSPARDDVPPWKNQNKY